MRNVNLETLVLGGKDMNDYFQHHGIKGQKWGVRRFQNYDGSLKKSVFISGSSKTQDKTSEYYRKRLPKEVRSRINTYIKEGDRILVGDAPGIDRQVQDYLRKKRYKDVEVYGPGEKVRYLADKKWKNTTVNVKDAEAFSSAWLAAKDIKMSQLADKGLAVILDNGAGATRKNIARLQSMGKESEIYVLSKYGKAFDEVTKLSDFNIDRDYTRR